MHVNLFNLKDIHLICCATEYEVKSVLIQIYAQFSNQYQPKIVILLDNILDGSTGLHLYNNVKSTQYKFNMNIEWILLTSTEDKNINCSINNF